MCWFDTWLRDAAVELQCDHVTVSTVYLNLVRTRMIAPSAHYRRAPAMPADEAAGVVCRSLAHPAVVVALVGTDRCGRVGAAGKPIRGADD
jgi:hypothetical protein